MAEHRIDETLRGHTLEWTVHLIDEMLASNEESLRIQDALPEDLRQRLFDVPMGYDGIAAAAALRCNPLALHEANVWLTGARNYLRSLSYPRRTMDDKTRTGYREGHGVRSREELIEIADEARRSVGNDPAQVAQLRDVLDRALAGASSRQDR